ncbi:MAG TPA: hypothetical protein VIZ19_20040 [Roseiarcus sp.]
MVNIAASIFQYIGLLATACLAILSLFFKFTEDETNSDRKRLTRPGRIAFGLIVASTIVGLASTIVKDVIDAQSRIEVELQRQQLLAETQLISKSFTSLEIRLIFDRDMNWRDNSFLSTGLFENLYTYWIKYNVTDGINADLCLSKKIDPKYLMYRTPVDALYIERRKELIAKFIKDEAPALANSLPDDLVFYGSAQDAKDSGSEEAIYYVSSVKSPVLDVHFSVPDPDEKLIYGIKNSDYKAMSIKLGAQASYVQIINSVIKLDFEFTTKNVTMETTDDNNRLTVQKLYPNVLPDISNRLKYIDVYMEGKIVKRVFDSAVNKIKYAHESQLNWKEDRFIGHLFELKFDHDLMVDWQRRTLSSDSAVKE